MSQINLDKKNDGAEDYNPYAQQVNNQANGVHQPHEKPHRTIDWKTTILLSVGGTILLNVLLQLGNFIF